MANGTTLQVKFKVTELDKYSDEQVVEAIAKKGYKGASKMTGPTKE